MSRTRQYRLSCWAKYAGELPTSTADIERFRAACPLSVATIEATVTAVVAHQRERGIPLSAGRRLQQPHPRPLVPTADELCRFYGHVRYADWPRCAGWSASKPTWLGDCSRVQWWRAYVVFSSWTGLRTSDMRMVTWAEWDAQELTATKKVGAPVPLIHSPHVERHLAPLRGLSDAIFVRVPAKQLNRELRAISEAAKIRPVTTQSLRRFAVTEWSTASDAAGAVLHGCGVRRYYLDRARIMDRAAPNVRIPDAFMSAAERRPATVAKRALIDALRRATPSERDWLVEAARKIG